tara:strand:- start:4991 stop:6121 length:1131 start_codon:yes stop_codon:yes gene_type:complete
MKDFIPVNEPLLTGNEKKYLLECIDSGWISSEGPFVKKFEEKFAARMDRKYGIAVTNGTSAIDAAVEAIGIKSGDEIILPTFTIISCILQIIRCGAKPVLIDSDPDTWNMDVSKIEKKINSKTKAIMVVHTYGLPVDMDKVINLCKKYDLKLIEDSAEMIGQTYNDRKCGSFGDISTVSFYSNKHITTGEGGMILTDNENIAKRCQELRNLCFTQGKRFVHERLGWNLRMTNIQASLGVAQLERLDEFLEKKRWIGKMYNQLFSETSKIQLPLKETKYAKNIYWVYGIVLDDSLKFEANTIINELSNNGIGSRPFFYPMHQQPVFTNQGLFKGESYPISERLYKRGFYLPSGLSLTEEKILHVSETLIKILKMMKD